MATQPTPATTRAKPKRTPTPDDPRQAFVHLAKRRVNRALGVIASIAPLANTRTYKYADEDITKIHDAIVGGAAKLRDRMKAALKGEAPTSGGTFSL